MDSWPAGLICNLFSLAGPLPPGRRSSTAVVDRYGLRQLVGVGVPALVGLLGSVLVAASPERPGVAVRLVAAGLGDDGPAQLAQQFGHGDRDQPPGGGGAAVTGALPGGGDGEEGAGEQSCLSGVSSGVISIMARW